MYKVHGTFLTDGETGILKDGKIAKHLIHSKRQNLDCNIAQLSSNQRDVSPSETNFSACERVSTRTTHMLTLHTLCFLKRKQLISARCHSNEAPSADLRWISVIGVVHFKAKCSPLLSGWTRHANQLSHETFCKKWKGGGFGKQIKIQTNLSTSVC